MKKRRNMLSMLMAATMIMSLGIPAAVQAKPLEETTIEKDAALSKQVAEEGTVLLKNDNQALPLADGAKIALFGRNQLEYIKGGQGSGDVFTSYVVDYMEGLENKEKDGRLELYRPLIETYKAAIESGEEGEISLSQEEISAAKENADTAVVFLGRVSGEGADRTATKGDYYLSDKESEMIAQVAGAGFEHVVVVLNIGSVMDLSWVSEYPQIDSVVLAWQGGMEGGNVLADVLCGDANPSGKTVDTFAASYQDYPTSSFFTQDNDVINYSNDIFVGYRYFETFDPEYKTVIYPFGYGLSYTTFELDAPEITVSDGVISVNVNVTNTGSCAGKETVQVYFSAPQGKLGKAGKELAAFGKTAELEPGASETLTLTFDVNDMAAYDDTGKVQESAYVLEAGDYQIYVGNSVKDAGERGAVYAYTVAEDTVTEQLSKQAEPHDLAARLTADGTYETLPTGSNAPLRDYEVLATEDDKVDYVEPEEDPILLKQVESGEADMNDFLAQLTDEELLSLACGQRIVAIPNSGGTGGIGNNFTLGIPNALTMDGPAGLNLGEYTVQFPSGTMRACTWNVELEKEVGEAIGEEALETGMDIWLAPGMNIHADPLGGRNFEYYSEDPLVTGAMATALTQGVESKGVAVTLKHFAVNGRENNRFNYDARISERALREIYLEGFRMAVEDGDAYCIMSSYNYINGRQAAENQELLTNILRNEWGFDGLVMSDWSNNSNQVNERLAGNNVHMPAGDKDSQRAALEDGTLTRYDLIHNAKDILNVMFKMNILDRYDQVFEDYYKNMEDPTYMRADIEDGTRIHPAEWIIASSDVIAGQGTSDEGGGQNLGYANAGEWVTFRVNVLEEGTYSVDQRIASAREGGSWELEVDGEKAATFSVDKATGGYQVWDTLGSQEVYLTEGYHELTVRIVEAGFNLNWLQFNRIK